MADDLEARLQGHAKAFEGLMSLLPPDLYYGKEKTGDEWNKKKQTKAEKKAARLAKLDPRNNKTAADVANERDRKRRLEDEEAERAAAGLDGPIEQPGEGLKAPKAKQQKTAKGQDVHSKSDEAQTAQDKKMKQQQDKSAAKEAKRKAKEAKQKEKRAAKAAKQAVKKETKQEKKPVTSNPSFEGLESEDEEEQDDEDDEEDQIDEEMPEVHSDDDMEAVDMSGLVDETSGSTRSSSRSASPEPEFSPHHNDRSSSTSSIRTPNEVEELRKAAPVKQKSASEPKQKQDSIPKPLAKTDDKHESPEEIAARKQAQVARLRELIEAKRAARNADGLNGKPARSRSELIEARRQKEQQRKEKKKELRAAEKDQLKKAEFEAHLASLRGSPSLGSELFAPRSRSASVSSPGVNPNNFSFGRVAFADGSKMNSNLSGLAEQTKKQKGPQDAKTQLAIAEKHQARLNGLDEAKKADLEEKDMWLTARKRISGEKIKDDVNLLKKSLKRKEKQKTRSEKQWNERIEGVQKSQAARQKRREENIQKRRDEKGSKGKKSKGVKKPSGNKNKGPRRAGFEGAR